MPSYHKTFARILWLSPVTSSRSILNGFDIIDCICQEGIPITITLLEITLDNIDYICRKTPITTILAGVSLRTTSAPCYIYSGRTLITIIIMCIVLIDKNERKEERI